MSAPITSADRRADLRFMGQALKLARQGLGRSSPNPAVGAVVVKDGKIVGRGFHALAGTPHGEALAMEDAGENARGATLYVTLEPCHHLGRTPPCTGAVLKAGIARVCFGASDPNPRVPGGGGEYLASQGVAVVPGVLQAECEEEHRFFFHHVTTGRPYIVLKTAATLDGHTATRGGESRWITGEDSRKEVHRQRNWLDAVCVGIGTALADDPQLTCRVIGGRDPVRVVVDTGLRLSPGARVLDPAAGAHCLVACGPRVAAKRRAALEKAGAEVLSLPRGPGGVDLWALVTELGKRGVTSLLLEGGADLAWGFASQGLLDEVMYFFAPKLLGGTLAKPMLGGLGYARMAQALNLGPLEVKRFGADVMIRARVVY